LYGILCMLKLQYKASLDIYVQNVLNFYITDQTTPLYAFINILRTQHFILRYLIKPFIVI